MSKLFLSALILLTVSMASAADNCFKNVPARTRVLTGWETQKYSFCTGQNLETLTSESCATTKKCEAKKSRFFPASMQAGLAGHGNPFYSTCEVAGGGPRRIEFISGDFKGQSLVICEFPDKSFINLSMWIRQYVQYKQPSVHAAK